MTILKKHDMRTAWVAAATLAAVLLACAESKDKGSTDSGPPGSDAGADSDSDADSDGDSGAPVDSGTCQDGTLRRGSTPCGLNDRGVHAEVCEESEWQDAETCIDPDECVDSTVADGGACGLNDRGIATDTCDAGQWDRVCDDPDDCADDDIQNGSTACGLNSRGVFEQLCITGDWQNTSKCVDPDECVDKATQDAGPCGYNDRGIATDTCVTGEWDTSCDDPDECEDTTTRDGDAGCDGGIRGVLLEECDAGHWAGTQTCHDWDLDIGGPCSCTGGGCVSNSNELWWGGTINGCTGMDASWPNASMACARSQSAGNNTAHWPNGYCTWMAVKCAGWVCSAGPVPTTGNYDGMTTCPSGRVLLNEVTGDVTNITLSRKFCLQGCTADAQCRTAESDPVWADAGVDAGAPRYVCRRLTDGGVGFCADKEQSFGGISVTVTQF